MLIFYRQWGYAEIFLEHQYLAPRNSFLELGLGTDLSIKPKDVFHSLVTNTLVKITCQFLFSTPPGATSATEIPPFIFISLHPPLQLSNVDFVEEFSCWGNAISPYLSCRYWKRADSSTACFSSCCASPTFSQ